MRWQFFNKRNVSYLMCGLKSAEIGFTGALALIIKIVFRLSYGLRLQPLAKQIN